MSEWGGLETNKRGYKRQKWKLRSSDRDVTTLTPGAGIWIVDGRVDVPQINFAHETIDLETRVSGEDAKERVGTEGGHETKSRTHVELSGEACEARLTINGRKDVKGQLLWLFYDDIFSGWIPPNHMVVFRTLEETVWKRV